MGTDVGDRAVVLGAGVAGLLAAGVLAEGYREVVVVDRDELPEDDEPRRSVPQGAHAHALLARGQQALEELLPGLTACLALRGAPVGDLLAQAQWNVSGHRLARADSGLILLAASRALLEGHIRARVRAIGEVRFLPRCDIVSPHTTSDRRRVTGVHVVRQDRPGVDELLGADLVVDATGRASRVPAWLSALGYPTPQQDRVRVGLGYATRTYRAPAPTARDQVGVLSAPTPAHPRGGVVQRIENDRWMLTLAGFAGDHPPTDPAGFDAFARTLPPLREVVADAAPLDDPVPFRFPASVRRRYERLRQFPDRLLVIGDGVCSLNPIYGHGMTVAALEALALRRHLRTGAAPNPRRWMREIARIVDVPWDMIVGGDRAMPGVEGRPTIGMRAIQTYLTRLHAAAAHDPELALAFARVAGLVDPPQRLLRPSTVARVLRQPKDGAYCGALLGPHRGSAWPPVSGRSGLRG